MVLMLTLFTGGIWYLKHRPAKPPEVAQVPQQTQPASQSPQAAHPAFSGPVQHHLTRAQRWAKKLAPEPPPTLESQWGIQVCGLRLTMANSALDLRYKVLDPDKAILLGNGKTPSFIFDQATGKKLPMPTPPKEGAFPPTANKLIAGKTYFAMVRNAGGTLKSGSEVTVVIGGSEATNLTVE